MFVYYYIHLPEPFEVVERRLLSLLSALNGMAVAAYREGEILRTRNDGRGAEHPVVAKTVRVEVGTPLRGGSETEVPITWRASGTPGLFRSMDAGIVVAALGRDLTQVTLRGSYAPPLDAAGAAVDRTLLQRFAEVSVKNFLERIAHSIEPGEDIEEAVAERW